MNDGKDPPPVTWDEAYAAEVDSEGGSALPTPTLEGSGDLKRVQSATPQGLEQRLLDPDVMQGSVRLTQSARGRRRQPAIVEATMGRSYSFTKVFEEIGDVYLGEKADR